MPIMLLLVANCEIKSQPYCFLSLRTFHNVNEQMQFKLYYINKMKLSIYYVQNISLD